MDRSVSRRGFTLVEMLVVVSIIALLVSITLPAISRARITARSAQDKANLRQLGVGLLTFSSRDPAGRLCSGAFDLQRDGCPDTFGWVADEVSLGIRPSEMLDPNSDWHGIDGLNELMTAPTSETPLDGGASSRMGQGKCGENATYNSATGRWGGLFAGTSPSTAQRSDFVARRFVEGGFSTNYAASWFLVRGAIRLSLVAGSTDNWRFVIAPGDTVGLAGTTGPLTTRTLDHSKVPSGTVPLLGDSAPGDINRAQLRTPITKDPAYYYAGNCKDPAKKVFFEAGERLGASFAHGPVAYDKTSGSLESLRGGTDVTSQVQCDRGDTPCAAAEVSVTSHGWLQNTGAWYPTQGKDCNFLMADGSVQSFSDENNDKYLNPGFPVTTGTSMNGIGPGPIELPPAQFYSGVFLEPVRPIY